jgi:ABC-type Na+ efflux pump permease subunit
MKFVGYLLFVLILTMCRSYAHERESFVKITSPLIVAMSHACMFLSILLAMLVLKLWLSCLSMSQF